MGEDVSVTRTVTACPQCLRLRTKMDYVMTSVGRPCGSLAQWDEDETHDGPALNHYCLHTMRVFGPDDDMVGPRLCLEDRPCYETSGF